MMPCRTSRRIVASFYFLVASSLIAAPSETRPVDGLRENVPSVHAFTNTRIVVSPEKVIDKGTVVVRDGVIVAVGADIDVPDDARVWDLSKKTIYPGLMDAYSEGQVSATSGGAGYWNSLVTPQLSFSDQYKPDIFLNEKMRKQGVVCRLLAPAPGVIKGSSVVVTTGADVGDRVILKANVAQHLRLGVPRSRGRDSYPNSPMGAVALARQAFLNAQWYKQAWTAYQSNSDLPRPERNDALASLAEHFDRQKLFVIDGPNELYFLRADGFAREFSLNAVIRGSGQEYQRLHAIRSTGRAVIVPVNFPKPPPVNSPEDIHDAELEELLHWDMAPENPARLDAAGVKIAFCSEGLRDPGEFLASIRTAVKRGLPAAAALRALTTTPAELFDLADRLGTVESGKAASFLITDGELFESKTKILETWVDGVRDEIEKSSPTDVRGTWQVKLVNASGVILTFEVKITGEPDKLQGAVQVPQADDKPREVKLDKLALRDGQLSGTFSGKEFRQQGVVPFSAVVLAPPDGTWGLTGTVAWPDGTRSPFSASRSSAHPSPSDKTADDKSGKEMNQADDSKERAVPEKAPDETSDKALAEDKTKSPDDKKKLAGTTDPSHEEKAADDKKSADAAKEKIDPKASFPVNYPLGAFGLSAPPSQPKDVVFKNATVWTCGPEGTLKNASVVVSNGKIVAIGAEVKIPDGATVIDVKGKHIAPGIIDCHSHMATDGGINEGTQAITAEVRVGDFIDCNDIDIYRQLAGGVTAANILHGSANPIGGQNQVIKLRWGSLFDEMRFAGAPPGIKFALGENVKRSNFSGEGSSRYPQSRMGVEQIIRDAFQAARDYQRSRQRWEQHHDTLPPRRDLELEAVLEIVEGKRWVHCHSYRQDEILALLRTCEEFGIRVATLQHILEGYKVADAIARHGAMGSSFSDWWAYKIEVYDAIPYNGALMHNAGVVVSFNSDDQELARHLNHEAAKATKYGKIAPEEALKFVTLNPAKQLRIDSLVGSLEPGKHADLVVWSGPPLALQSRCEQTWIDGRKYFDLAEDQQAREAANKKRLVLVQKILASGQAPKSAEESQKPDEELWPREDIYCRAKSTLGSQ